MGTVEDGGVDERRRMVERAHAVSEELRGRMTELASAVADTEELVARTYEGSATVRPHAAERLTEAARDARSFAARERAEARRLTVPEPEGGDADDGPPGVVAPPS